MVEYYEPFTAPFDPEKACYVIEHHAMPLIQLDPVAKSLKGPTLQNIAKGRYNGLLAREAQDIHAFGRPIALGFAHEMNGDWYPWNTCFRPNPSHPERKCPWRSFHNTPSLFVEAWRQVHHIFVLHHATNVKWIWEVTADPPKVASSYRAYFPGNNYLNWIGITYYDNRRDTTSLGLGDAVEAIRRFTNNPILLAETATRHWAPAVDKTQIVGLFQKVLACNLLGLIWFNGDGPTRHRWSLLASDRGGDRAVIDQEVGVLEHRWRHVRLGKTLSQNKQPCWGAGQS
jgi:hypothetical protein